ncbi:Uncharacterized protein HZ326_26237 [Fusarium oxysporum f. sp. albedinis]|nr:Uncharacterized protein HZ326_26237 [Fusarium oxysporum f. sp. albedinis]
MWGISVFQDLYFSLVLAFRAGKKNKTRSANHAYVVPLFSECVYKSMAGNQSFRNPSPRSSGQPATSNANKKKGKKRKKRKKEKKRMEEERQKEK